MRAENPQFYFKMYAESGEGRLVNSSVQNSSMQIVEVVSGVVEIRIGTELLVAQAGDFAYIPPKMVHSIYSISGTASIRGIVFETSILHENIQNYNTEERPVDAPLCLVLCSVMLCRHRRGDSLLLEVV
jgi:hypothetical protein